MYRKTIKPVLDRLLGITCFVLAIPFLCITAVLVYLFISHKVVFVQERIGYRERPFKLYKFRSMRSDGYYAAENESIPRVGRFIRKFGLDELPQLLNVIKGEMSFVGPRPLLPEYLALYTLEERKRHHVVPGITGLAQVSGRNEIEWKKRFTFDLQYVQEISFGLDLRILVKTALVLMKGSDSMPPQKFEGHTSE
ncbi:MAG: sugar transferase [Bacteroidetes bacterium]|nr:MAG: sugar transferase [Bacteroidota bacterium]